MKNVFTLSVLLYCLSIMGQDNAIIEKIKKENCTYNGYSYEEQPLIEYRKNLDIYVMYFGKDYGKRKVSLFNHYGDKILSSAYSSYGFTSDSDLAIFQVLPTGIVGYKEVCQYNSSNEYLYGVINNKGEEIIPCKYSSIKLVNCIPVAIVVEGEVYSYDDDGFRKDLIKNGKWGIYDLENKKPLLPCKYEYIENPSTAFYGSFVVDSIFSKEKEKEEISLAFFPFNVGGNKTTVFGAPQKGKWGFMDIYGNIVIEPIYDSYKILLDGYLQVVKGKESIILSRDGKAPTTSETKRNEIDDKIPVVSNLGSNENTFAFVIGNERYLNFKGANYSINDAKIFSVYCEKTLRIPSRNIRYYEDITYGNILSVLNKIKDISEAYDGDAKIIFYFSGLGYTETDGIRYLLPVDASDGQLTKTSASLNFITESLDKLNNQYTLCIIDAPFSNKDKNGFSLFNNRGVVVKTSNTHNKNVILWLSGHDSFSNSKYQHSLFTYGILKELKESKGTGTLEDIEKNMSIWLKQTALDLFDKVQSPTYSYPDKINSHKIPLNK